jgi:WD40 repeat protein
MSTNQIGLEIPQKELNFKIGSAKNSFPVVVINDSNQFSSFQIELIAAGADIKEVGYEWYTISPDVSVKIPPGDLVEFVVSIIETPISGFTGIMNITVRAFSIELREENREVLRINLQEGTGRSILRAEITSQKLQAIPLDDLEIPILIGNPSQQTTNVTLTCRDLPDSWFPRGNTQQFTVKAGAQFRAAFICTLPFDHDAIAKSYPFTIDISHTNGLPSQLQSSLEVLPKGELAVVCSPKLQILPAKRSWKFWWKFWQSSPAIFALTANNASNLPEKINFDLENVNSSDYEDFSFEVSPNEAEVEPFNTTDLQLQIDKSRPWLGKAQKLNLLVKANWQDTRVNTIDEVQTIEVVVKPIVPLFLLVLLLAIVLFLMALLSNPNTSFPPHQGAVTSVRYDGTGGNAVSSSNDRTIRMWNVSGFYRPFGHFDLGTLTEAKKAIRTVRYRPVSNDLLAAGLENGEIQILDSQVENKRPIATFINQADDRVFGLEYTLDSRTLFSGHGSGTVLRWDLQNLFTNPPTQPSQVKKFDLAINAIALVGQDDSTLAIAGRYNQLVLWNWVNNTVKTIPYPNSGGQDDYIQSIAVPDRKRNLLATADNQGYLSVWDLSTCLQGDRPCQMIDGWKDAHKSKPVRSVAFSSQGCYLASGGDDGQTKLWALTANGKRTGDLNGKTIENNNAAISAVDIHLTAKDILILSGTTQGRVLGQKTERMFNLGCDINQ